MDELLGYSRFLNENKERGTNLRAKSFSITVVNELYDCSVHNRQIVHANGHIAMHACERQQTQEILCNGCQLTLIFKYNPTKSREKSQLTKTSKLSLQDILDQNITTVTFW